MSANGIAQEYLLVVKGLSKRFGDTTVLQDVSCTVREGEILGLIGPNGAGKTTFFECLAGLMPTDTGLVGNDTRLLSATERKQMLFYVPDGIRPWSDQQVDDVVKFIAQLNARSMDEATEILVAVKLEQSIGKRIWMLSK